VRNISWPINFHDAHKKHKPTSKKFPITSISLLLKYFNNMPNTCAAATIDARNLEWRNNNIGAKLLEKMGWKDGQAVGRRSTEATTVSSEGLRIQKRQTGLGLGAAHVTAAVASENHVQAFSDLLAELNSTTTAADDNNKKSKPKKKRKSQLPTNKTTHHKIRKAKFQTRSQEDFKCIFAGTTTVAEVADDKPTNLQATTNKKKSKKVHHRQATKNDS
jgi:hypothetical protein